MSDLMKCWDEATAGEGLAKVWLIGSSTRARSEGREGAGRECCSSRGDAPGLKEKRAPSVGLDGPQGCQGDKRVSFHYVCGSGQSILSYTV